MEGTNKLVKECAEAILVIAEKNELTRVQLLESINLCINAFDGIAIIPRNRKKSKGEREEMGVEDREELLSH